ncbi:transposase [Brevibacterium picturae]|uniref:Transposase n=1 Tax=Brevibacterium picturae TaxID=260553 RepID=A0ABN2BZQ7_9MICO
MPQPYPQEFRDDVVRVVMGRDKNTTIGKFAKDFGVHEATIAKWVRQAEIDAGNKPGQSNHPGNSRSTSPRNRSTRCGEDMGAPCTSTS